MPYTRLQCMSPVMVNKHSLATHEVIRQRAICAAAMAYNHRHLSSSIKSVACRQHTLKVVEELLHLEKPEHPVRLDVVSKVKWLPVPTSQLVAEAAQIFSRRGPAYRIGIIGDTESKYEIMKAIEFDDILENLCIVKQPGGPHNNQSLASHIEKVGMGTEEDGLYIGPYLIGKPPHYVKNVGASRADSGRFEFYSYPIYYDMPVSRYMYKYKAFAMSLLIRLFTCRLTEKDEELAIFCHHLGIPLAFLHTEGNALSERFNGKPGKLTIVPPHERTACTEPGSTQLPATPHCVLTHSGLIPFGVNTANSKSADQTTTAFFLVCARTLLSLTRGRGRQSCFDELQFLHWRIVWLRSTPGVPPSPSSWNLSYCLIRYSNQNQD
eukprot:Gregarina_sp_Poly_1__557@NODE_1133_length_4987_cov_534_950407_g341_i1_p2_GENE_NODE_1133_length_4987_cov_534_950407_g341_i1NODE_1133_length_4987_cov_534_950407_g341_i1_p2_ORF_typecomplete_len380_score25_37IIGP/PF05049_13/0_048_NODE_1133_length_4987_cov_534_950407_g341_i19122051